MDKPKIKLRNFLLVLKDQGPLLRFFRNFFISENSRGLFHIRSHQRDNGREKIKYNTKKTAEKVAAKMGKKHNCYFSNYKCIYCDGYHIGKNKEDKNSNLD